MVLIETEENEEIIQRVAAVDLGKAELVCCVRVPHETRAGQRLPEVQTYSTMTRSLLGMADHLRALGVTRVVMEATSAYWKPVYGARLDVAVQVAAVPPGSSPYDARQRPRQQRRNGGASRQPHPDGHFGRQQR